MLENFLQKQLVNGEYYVLALKFCDYTDKKNSEMFRFGKGNQKHFLKWNDPFWERKFSFTI